MKLFTHPSLLHKGILYVLEGFQHTRTTRSWQAFRHLDYRNICGSFRCINRDPGCGHPGRSSLYPQIHSHPTQRLLLPLLLYAHPSSYSRRLSTTHSLTLTHRFLRYEVWMDMCPVHLLGDGQCVVACGGGVGVVPCCDRWIWGWCVCCLGGLQDRFHWRILVDVRSHQEDRWIYQPVRIRLRTFLPWPCR